MATIDSMIVDLNGPLFVFAGGGSGGHIAPAIVTAKMLRRQFPESRHQFLCSTREIDRRMLRDAFGDERCFTVDFAFDYTMRSGLRGSIHTALQLLVDTVRAVRILRDLRPAAVISIGARPAIAPGLAARILRIPLILLESNVIPGATTRLLSRFARLAVTGLPIHQLHGRAIRCPQLSAGIPLCCSELSPSRQQSSTMEYPQRRQLLILGGSQGATELNHSVPAAIRNAGLLDKGWSVLHQHGQGKEVESMAAWDTDVSRVTLTPFLQSPVAELARSAIVICRSGAVTLAEISLAGIPALLLPLQNSSHSHQWQNALWARDSGFAEIVDSSAESTAEFSRQLQDLCSDEQRRLRMCAAATAVARPNAALNAANAIASAMNYDVGRSGTAGT